MAIEAHDKASEIFSKVEGALGKLSKSLNKSAQDASSAGAKHEAAAHQMFSGWEKGAMVAGGAVAAGAAMIIGASLKSAAEYEKSTATLAAQSAVSVKAASEVGKAFLSTAGDSTFSAQEIMQAYGPVSGTFITMTGHALKAKDALTVMTAATNLAEASGTPLASTTKTLANIMLAYHVKVKDAAAATDSLFNASRLTNTGVDRLGMMMTMLRSRIQGANLSVKDMSGYMVEMASKIGNGRMAVRLAGTTIQQLVQPTGQAKKVLDQLGISTQDASGHFIGMPAVLDRLKLTLAGLPPKVADITKAVGGSSRAMRENVTQSAAYQAMQVQIAQLSAQRTVPGVSSQIKVLHAEEAAMRAAARGTAAHTSALQKQQQPLDQTRVLTALFGRNAETMRAIVEGGSAAFIKNANAVGKAGSAQAAAKKNSETFEGQMKTLHATMKDMEITIGNALLPVLEKMMHTIIPIVKTIAEWVSHHQKLVTTILLGAVALGSLVVALLAGLKAFKIVKQAIEDMKMVWEALNVVMDMNPFVAIALAVVALGVALYEAYNHIKWFHDFVDAAWQDIQTVTETVWNFISGFFKRFWPIILGIMTAGVGLIIVLIVRHWDQIKHVVQTGINVVIGIYNTIVNFFKRFWPYLLAIATGGLALLVLLIVKNWDKIKDAFTTAIHDVLDFFTSIPGKLLDAGEAMIHGLWKGIQDAWSDIVSFFTGVEHDILGFFSTAAGWLVDIGKDIINGLLKGFGIVMKLVKLFYVTLPTTILSWIGDATMWLYDKGTDILSGLWNGIKDLWEREVHFWTDLPGKILDLLRSAGMWLRNVGGQIISGLWNGITTLWNREVTFFITLPGKIIGFFVGAATWLWNAGVNLVAGLVNGIGDVATTVWNIFLGVFNSIQNFFSNVGSWLWNAGVDLIKGLVGGITSIPGAVGDAITSVIPHSVMGVKLPWGAEGGLIDHPMVLGAGEAGPELLLPLTDFKRSMDLLSGSGLMDKMVQQMQMQKLPQLAGGALGGAVQTPSPTRLVSVGGSGQTMIVDARGSYLLSDRALDDFIKRISDRLVNDILPASGMVIRR